MVLVGMGQDDEVDPPVPRRHVGVEGDEEAVGVRAAVDEHPRATIAVDEDRIALADVEDGDPQPAVGPGRGDRDHRHERDRQTGGHEADRPRRHGQAVPQRGRAFRRPRPRRRRRVGGRGRGW